MYEPHWAKGNEDMMGEISDRLTDVRTDGWMDGEKERLRTIGGPQMRALMMIMINKPTSAAFFFLLK